MNEKKWGKKKSIPIIYPDTVRVSTRWCFWWHEVIWNNGPQSWFLGQGTETSCPRSTPPWWYDATPYRVNRFGPAKKIASEKEINYAGYCLSLQISTNENKSYFINYTFLNMSSIWLFCLEAETFCLIFRNCEKSFRDRRKRKKLIFPIFRMKFMVSNHANKSGFNEIYMNEISIIFSEQNILK